MAAPECIFIGEGSIDNVAPILEKQYCSKIFLVTGKHSFEASGSKEKLDPFLKNKTVVHFSDFSTNPKVEDAERGVSLFLEQQCDFILAVGGGSVLDMAKLVNAFASCPSCSPKELISSQDKLQGVASPLLAIPTTAGSGSEATHFAVVYVDGIKHSVAYSRLRPDYVIVDPQLTYGLSARQCAISGLDALSQAIESFWAVNATQESRNYAKKAIDLILKHLEASVCEGQASSRDAISRAAYYAGRAIDISKTTAAHALSYGVTTHCGIPHGHAVALILGQLFYIHAHAAQLKLGFNSSPERLEESLGQLCELFQLDDAEAFMDNWYALLGRLGLASKLDLISDKDIDIIIKAVNLERLNNNPVAITEDIAKKLLKEDFREKYIIR